MCHPIPLCIPKKKHPLRDPEWQGVLSQLEIEDCVLQFTTQYHPQGEWPICKDNWGVDHRSLHIVSSLWCQACAGTGVVWVCVLHRHRQPFHVKHWNQTCVGEGRMYWMGCHYGGVNELHYKDYHPKWSWRTEVQLLDPRVWLSMMVGCLKVVGLW